MEFENLEQAAAEYKKLQAELEKQSKTAETRKAERQEAQSKYKEAIAKLEKYGDIDPEKYASLLEAETKREEERLKAEGEFDELRKKDLETIAQLQTKLKEADIRVEEAIASSLSREKRFVMAQDFIKAGGNPDQLDNFLTVGEGLYKYEVGEDNKGVLSPSEVILGEDNKPIESSVDAMKHFANTPTYGVFFNAQNGSNTGPAAGTAPADKQTGALEGKVWV